MSQQLWKYPRTPHMPFSLGAQSDDKVLKSLDHLTGREAVTTLKMDGEQTSLYRHHMHARSLDSRGHEARSWLQGFHASIAHLIPDGWRVCGENLFARHSLEYSDLESYFMGFSVWNERNETLGWDQEVEFMRSIGVVPVKVILRGVFDVKGQQALAASLDTTRHEGFVTRLTGPIAYSEFERSYAKWVRKDHVVTDKHWRHQTVVPNGLARKASGVAQR